MTDIHYLEPGWFTRKVFNPAIAASTRLGLSVWGSRVLAVRGRTTGDIHETPVNLLVHDTRTYLVAPRGVTQWVRNLRAAGEGTLRVGKRVETFRAEEIDDADKTEILRAYLARWKFEVGAFFDGVDAKSSDDEVQRIAPKHPVFHIVITPKA